MRIPEELNCVSTVCRISATSPADSEEEFFIVREMLEGDPAFSLTWRASSRAASFQFVGVDWARSCGGCRSIRAQANAGAKAHLLLCVFGTTEELAKKLHFLSFRSRKAGEESLSCRELMVCHP